MEPSTNTISRQRLNLFRRVTLLEGISLILLVCIAVPIKYGLGDPFWVRVLGPVHGALFIAFAYLAWDVGTQVKWNWSKMFWILLLATFVPFGTFYLDHKVLKHL